MKKTAVDCLIEDLTRLGHNFKLYKKEIEQAKEVEKQQISNAYQIGIIDGLNHQPRDYYEETFKTK